MKKARKNNGTKEHICVQSIVNVTMSSSTNNRNGYIGKFMTDAGFTARLGRQVSISEETHERSNEVCQCRRQRTGFHGKFHREYHQRALQHPQCRNKGCV